MTYTNELKVNVNKLNADEALLVCIDIFHPFVSETIRLVNDNKELISETNSYIPMPFTIQRQSDIRGELPKITLTISNIGRELVKWIDSSGGGKGAEIVVKLIRRSSPDVVEEALKLGISSVVINTQSITFNLEIKNNLVKRSVKIIYDKNTAPSLF